MIGDGPQAENVLSLNDRTSGQWRQPGTTGGHEGIKIPGSVPGATVIGNGNTWCGAALPYLPPALVLASFLFTCSSGSKIVDAWSSVFDGRNFPGSVPGGTVIGNGSTYRGPEFELH